MTPAFWHAVTVRDMAVANKRLRQANTELRLVCAELCSALQDHIKHDAQRENVTEDAVCPCKTTTLKKAQALLANTP